MASYDQKNNRKETFTRIANRVSKLVPCAAVNTLAAACMPKPKKNGQAQAKKRRANAKVLTMIKQTKALIKKILLCGMLADLEDESLAVPEPMIVTMPVPVTDLVTGPAGYIYRKKCATSLADTLKKVQGSRVEKRKLREDRRAKKERLARLVEPVEKEVAREPLRYSVEMEIDPENIAAPSENPLERLWKYKGAGDMLRSEDSHVAVLLPSIVLPQYTFESEEDLAAALEQHEEQQRAIREAAYAGDDEEFGSDEEEDEVERRGSRLVHHWRSPASASVPGTATRAVAVTTPGQSRSGYSTGRVPVGSTARASVSDLDTMHVDQGVRSSESEEDVDMCETPAAVAKAQSTPEPRPGTSVSDRTGIPGLDLPARQLAPEVSISPTSTAPTVARNQPAVQQRSVASAAPPRGVTTSAQPSPVPSTSKEGQTSLSRLLPKNFSASSLFLPKSTSGGQKRGTQPRVSSRLAAPPLTLSAASTTSSNTPSRTG